MDAVVALLAYADEGRELVARLKYRNRRDALRWLGRALAHAVRTTPWSFDLVTWAPTTRRRRGDRGFDQAALLARAVAAELDLPCRALLVRRPGRPQTGLLAADRRRGPEFALRTDAALPPAVLLVDDVVTTGATVSAAARALRRAGAEHVVVAAAARTPKRARHAT